MSAKAGSAGPAMRALRPAARERALGGLHKLLGIIPLPARQAELPPAWAAAHRAILRTWAATGGPPGAASLVRLAAGTEAQAMLARLCAADLVVGDAGALRIDGAYPFSAEATGHRVLLGEIEVRAMCAVDALSMSPMLGRPVRIESRCRVSGRPVHLGQNDTRLDGGPGIARLRVGIHWRRPAAGCCTAHTLCREMVFLDGAEAAETWRAPAPGERELFGLDEAVALGAAFFGPLLAD